MEPDRNRQVLAAAAHDFNNALTIILTVALDVIRGADEELSWQMALIRDAGHKLQHTAASIVCYLKMTGGTRELAFAADERVPALLEKWQAEDDACRFALISAKVREAIEDMPTCDIPPALYEICEAGDRLAGEIIAKAAHS